MSETPERKKGGRCLVYLKYEEKLALKFKIVCQKESFKNRSLKEKKNPHIPKTKIADVDVIVPMRVDKRLFLNHSINY